jgi:anion-transporting  ArsA/GET3 family ATPase
VTDKDQTKALPLPPPQARLAVPFLDIDKIIGDRDTKIIICCGSGGVGKTTTSAAIALRAAEAGRKVVVLTIDPARRLAQSLGVGELDNTPRPVPVIDTTAGGSLDAMMLDMKGTFDDVVIAHSTPDKAEAILQNQFYAALSSEFSGTQEYMAMEKHARPLTSSTPQNISARCSTGGFCAY